MKRLLLFTFVSLFSFSFISAQTINWQTGSGDPCAGTGNGTANSTSDASCITIVSLCRGAGLNSTAGGDFNSNNFDTSNASCADAIADDDCLTFGFDLAAGCTIGAGSTLEFQLDRSGTGPPNYCLDMDDGSGYSSLSTGTISSSTGCVNATTSADITGPTTVTFRLCAWGATSGAGTMDIEDGVTSCGGSTDGGILFTAAAVPVEFGTVEARTQNDKVELYWETHSEINNEYFDVQWSRDGKDFQSIGDVAGAGNSARKNSYALTHDDPVSGQNIYRIKQVDFDGNYAYSVVVSARMDKETIDIALTPSPVRDELFLSVTEGISVEIFSLSGVRVKSTSNIVGGSLDLSDLQSGIYMVRIHSQNEIITKKIVKK